MFKKTIVCASAVFACIGAAAAGEVNVNGSTTVLPAMQYVAEAFMKANPDVTVTISATGSGNGIKALRDGMTDVAMSSRDMKSKEAADFKAHGITPKKIVVAHDAIIPIVHSSNKVAALSKDDLKKIFAGKIRSWKEVGGADAPIVVIGRDSSSGTFESWSELVMKGERVTPRALVQASNGGVSQAVAGNKNAIGYVGIGYLTDKVNGVSVDGVEASVESAAEGAWPISRELLLFTNENPAGEARALVDFMTSSEGQDLVEKAGFVRVK